MTQPDRIARMHEVIRSLGPVWLSGRDGDEGVVLSPGGPFCTDDDLSSAERKMGVRLPEEYKAFALHYGSPYFMSHKIMAVYPADYDNAGELPASDDIIAHYELNIRHGLLRNGEVAFMETDENGVFFFRCAALEDRIESSSEVFRVFGNDDEREVFAPSMVSLFARWVVEDG